MATVITCFWSARRSCACVARILEALPKVSLGGGELLYILKGQ